MREIQLTRGQVALVSDEDYDRISAHKWMVEWCRSIKAYYAIRGDRYYLATSKNGKHYWRRHTVYMHKEVMGATDEQEVDHKNRKSLDNQRDNLRFCTRAQNLYNKPMHAGKLFTKYKGVHKQVLSDNFYACIGCNHKSYYLGTYSTQEEAALVYNEAAKKYHGEFAYLNAV